MSRKILIYGLQRSGTNYLNILPKKIIKKILSIQIKYSIKFQEVILSINIFDYMIEKI